jgi:hypothetical protein
VPDGDIFIHAGDESSPKMPPAPEIWVMRSNPKQRRASTGRTALRLVLLSGTHEIEGLRMWGSPVTPMYGGAFGLSSAVDRKRLYARIPWDIDVLVSHGPPFGILDTAPISGLHEGCRELLDAVTRVKPKLHVFGHIHTAYGTYQTEHTIFINAARLGLHDAADKPPFVLQITRR